ncbi:META domain-containing protein [Paracoccaceae bacterium GXU_MW_L88]
MKTLLLLCTALAVSGCYWQRQDTIATTAGSGGWQLVEVDESPIAYRATISFPSKNRIAGEAPCNSFLGKQAMPLPWFQVENLAVTERACPEMASEAAFFEALDAMRFAESSPQTLLLTGEGGRSMLFAAVNAEAD